jgi:hypothetical protein
MNTLSFTSIASTPSSTEHLRATTKCLRGSMYMSGVGGLGACGSVWSKGGYGTCGYRTLFGSSSSERTEPTHTDLVRALSRVRLALASSNIESCQVHLHCDVTTAQLLVGKREIEGAASFEVRADDESSDLDYAAWELLAGVGCLQFSSIM